MVDTVEKEETSVAEVLDAEEVAEAVTEIKSDRIGGDPNICSFFLFFLVNGLASYLTNKIHHT